MKADYIKEPGGITMQRKKLSDELKQILLDAGASLVGIGDMSEVLNCSFPIGISVAVPLPVNIVKSLKKLPTWEYYDAYCTLNNKLDDIICEGAEFLSKKGYTALAQTRDYVDLDREHWISPIPHKTVATRSGLGWIGKNCLLVTHEFGSAVRISSFLTDAPLLCDTPIDVSFCGECTLCVDACPAQALTGTLWKKKTKREQIIDVQKCYRKQKEIMFAGTGIDKDLCGKCFAVCAYTNRYLNGNF